MISKQRTLYELAGLEEAHFQTQPSICTITNLDDDADMVQEDEYMVQYEAIEDAPMFEDDGEFISEDVEEEQEEPTAVIKIEKIHNKIELKEEALGSSEVFDFFEEIVAESEGEEAENYEAVEDESSELVSCDVCGIDLSKSHLSEHCKVMHAPFNCKECNKKFQSKISLKRHAMETHSSVGDKSARSKKKHFCPLCQKNYDYRKQVIF